MPVKGKESTVREGLSAVLPLCLGVGLLLNAKPVSAAVVSSPDAEPPHADREANIAMSKSVLSDFLAAIIVFSSVIEIGVTIPNSL